ncbi:hypothetical protein Bca4012_021437 [Brassica carinata]
MDSSSSSSSSRKKKDKLSVRKQTLFKKSSTSLLVRQETILRKACELSTLCDNQICVIHYDSLGNLVKTWPEDESQVQDIAERFSQLTDEEKQKKSMNLSKFVNKKMHDEKKRSLSDKKVRIKFSQKVQDLEGSLVNKLQLLQDMSNRLAVVPDHQQQTESATRTEQDMSRAVYNSDAATNALNHQSKFSIFMFNHENASFTQLAPHSNLEQSCYNNLNDNRVLLGTQGFIDVGYDSNILKQGFNFGYDNNSVTIALPGEQGNYGYYNSLLDTQGFGYDNNLNNTQDFNNLCT